MSFVGGGSDLREYYKNSYGSVVSTAIDKFVYITVNKRFTDHIRVGYSKIEYVENINKIEHNLVREALNEYRTITLINTRSFDESFIEYEGKLYFWFNDSKGSTHAVSI